jgi:hypothetical protein
MSGMGWWWQLCWLYTAARGWGQQLHRSCQDDYRVELLVWILIRSHGSAAQVLGSNKTRNLVLCSPFCTLHRTDKIGLESCFTFPREMLPSAADTGVCYLSAGRHVVELLTPCLLRCHVSRLVYLYWDFQVGEVVSCDALWLWWIVSSCITNTAKRLLFLSSDKGMEFETGSPTEVFNLLGCSAV